MFSGSPFVRKMTSLLVGYVPDILYASLLIALDVRVPFDDPYSLQVYMAHFFSGTSLRSLLHYAQGARDKKMALTEFDFGSDELNIKAYGSPLPPQLTFDRLGPNLPIAMITADSDGLADITDTAWLADVLKT